MSSEKYLVGFSKELDFRPIECVDLPFTRYCCLCSVVPTVTFLLGCSHAFCELCYGNLLGSDRRCPLDETDFEEDDVSKLTFKAKHLERTNVRCFNAKNGCNVVGTTQEVESHFFDECAYYAVICTRCKASVLRRDVVSHYRTSCHQEGMSSVSSTGVHVPISGCSFDPVSVESVLKKVSTVEHQLHGYAEEIDSLKEMALRNEQLLNRVLENQERVAADVGNTENKVTQQVQDQAEIKGSLRGVAELLSVVELQMSSISRDNVATSAVNKNVEQVSERVGNLMDTLQQISDTLNDVKGIKGELNPLLQCSAELTKFMNADEEAKEKMPLVKAILGTSTEIGIVAERVYTLYSSAVQQKMEASFRIGGFENIFRERSLPNYRIYWLLVDRTRKSDVFVLCGYSVRLHGYFTTSDTLSLRFELCMSRSDTLLKWPYTIPFTCRFMHPRDTTKDIVYRTVHPKTDLNGGCNNGAYCRPTSAENNAVLFEPAPSLPTLRKDGFIHDDSVCIGIRLHPEME